MKEMPQGTYEKRYAETERILFSYQDMVRDRDAIKTKIEILRSEMLPKSPAMNGMPGGGTQSDKMADYIVKVEDYTKKLQEAYDRVFRAMVRLESIISLVDDSILRQLLTYRYLKGAKWEDIADVMGYSERRMFQLRIDALRAVSNIIDDGK